MIGVRANSSLQWWKHLTADLDSAVDLRRAYDVTYVCGWRGCQHASLCVVLITLWSWTSILCGASHNRNKKKNLWCISLVGPYSLLFFCVFFLWRKTYLLLRFFHIFEHSLIFTSIVFQNLPSRIVDILCWGNVFIFLLIHSKTEAGNAQEE